MVCPLFPKEVSHLGHLGLDPVSGRTMEERALNPESILGGVIGPGGGGSCWSHGVPILGSSTCPIQVLADHAQPPEGG